MTGQTPSRPPRGPFLLLRLLHRELRELVRRDLEEEYQAVAAERGRRAASLWLWEYAARSLLDAVRDGLRNLSPAGVVKDLGWDVRLAARSLRRTPAFALAVVATLSVALGGATIIAGLMDTVFWAQLPMDSGPRLVRLRDFSLGPSGEHLAYNMSPRDFLAIRDGTRAFSGVVGMNGYSLSLVGPDGAVPAQGIEVSEGWTSILGVKPVLGRPFTPEEEARGRDAGVALISHSLWKDYFGGAPDVLGRSLRYDGGQVVVVGVMPAGFAFPYDAQLWTPERFNASNVTNFDLAVFGTLRPGTTLDAAVADLGRIWAGLVASAPGTQRNDGLDARMARDDFVRQDAASLKGLGAAVLFLVLLACANIANLFTVRFLARSQETALRAALGAGRLRLFRLAVTESVLLFLVGGLGGLAVAAGLGDTASTLIPPTLRNQLALASLRFGGPVIAFAVGLALLAGVATGALAAARATRVDLQSALREDGRSGTSRGARRIQNTLVVVELALALVLLQEAAVLVGRFRSLDEADLGFSTRDLYAVQLTLSQDRYAEPDARAALERRLEESMEAVPGVEAVGLTSVNPLCCGDWGAQVRVEGMERPRDAPPITVHHRYVTPGYFPAMGLAPLRGRVFGSGDTRGGRPVVVVDEAAAKRFWPGQDAVGKRIARRDPSAPWLEVVGVVPTIYEEGDYHEAWYLPFYQDPTGRSTDNFHFMVRARSADVLPAVRRAVASVDPMLAVQRMSSMRALRREHLASDLAGGVVATLFAAVGLVLACLGLYGLIAYQVGLRGREIGTRLALGARRGDVVTSILIRTLRLVGMGTGVGVVLAYGANVFLATQVEDLGAARPLMAATLVAILCVAALASAALPATRAARLDPARVLRSD